MSPTPESHQNAEAHHGKASFCHFHRQCQHNIFRTAVSRPSATSRSPSASTPTSVEVEVEKFQIPGGASLHGPTRNKPMGQFLAISYFSSAPRSTVSNQPGLCEVCHDGRDFFTPLPRHTRHCDGPLSSTHLPRPCLDTVVVKSARSYKKQNRETTI